MDEAADIVARMQRFNEAARAYTPPSPSRNAKLAPFKDGIVQLREKAHCASSASCSQRSAWRLEPAPSHASSPR
jgi:hypothetical protein